MNHDTARSGRPGPVGSASLAERGGLNALVSKWLSKVDRKILGRYLHLQGMILIMLGTFFVPLLL